MATGKDGYFVMKFGEGATLEEAMDKLEELNRTGTYKGMQGTYEFCDGREIKFYPKKGAKRRNTEPDPVGPFA